GAEREGDSKGSYSTAQGGGARGVALDGGGWGGEDGGDSEEASYEPEQRPDSGAVSRTARATRRPGGASRALGAQGRRGPADVFAEEHPARETAHLRAPRRAGPLRHLPRRVRLRRPAARR